ncbi:uncharacterized protein LOC112574306 [Pomacea canaliculata]|uniref:uncharacterized protein LOC112574306 n=1 Tax=Pomacea canaliculata TaxID=400727 RepID=UPI000D72B21E|nr:uncharacterized protein LOC112574306 [Pomacea canaliculata]
MGWPERRVLAVLVAILCLAPCTLLVALSPDLKPSQNVPTATAQTEPDWHSRSLSKKSFSDLKSTPSPDLVADAGGSVVSGGYGKSVGDAHERTTDKSDEQQEKEQRTSAMARLRQWASPTAPSSTAKELQDVEGTHARGDDKPEAAVEKRDKHVTPWSDDDAIRDLNADYPDHDELEDDIDDDIINKKESPKLGVPSRHHERYEQRQGQDGGQEEGTKRWRQQLVRESDDTRQDVKTQASGHASDLKEEPPQASRPSSGAPRESATIVGTKADPLRSEINFEGHKYEKVKSRNRPKWLSHLAGQRQTAGGGLGTEDLHVNHEGLQVLSPSPPHSLTTDEALTPAPLNGERDKHDGSSDVPSDLGVKEEHRQSSMEDNHDRVDDYNRTKESRINTSDPHDDKWSAMKQKKTAYLKSCPACQAGINEARTLRLQVLRDQLLDKLRMVPRFKSSPWRPKLPDQVFPDYLQHDESDVDSKYYARTTELIVLGRDLGRHRLRREGTGSYQFAVTGKVKGSVSSAELWVYKMADANDVHGQTLIITELDFRKGRHLQERSLVARLETKVQEGWVSFDVTRLVQRWEEAGQPAPMQLLAIRCKTCARTNYRAIFGAKSNFRPVLVMHLQSTEEHERKRRSTCDPEFDCCKFDLFVHFRDLGIHEVLHPRTIKADYCYGSCDRPDLGHYHHSQLMQNYRWNNDRPINSTLRERVKPCCVPVVLRQTSIMYYNNSLNTQINNGVVPNILVDKCGCA